MPVEVVTRMAPMPTCAVGAALTRKVAPAFLSSLEVVDSAGKLVHSDAGFPRLLPVNRSSASIPGATAIGVTCSTGSGGGAGGLAAEHIVAIQRRRNKGGTETR